jgi:hypothetical protein
MPAGKNTDGEWLLDPTAVNDLAKRYVRCVESHVNLVEPTRGRLR